LIGKKRNLAKLAQRRKRGKKREGTVSDLGGKHSRDSAETISRKNGFEFAGVLLNGFEGIYQVTTASVNPCHQGDQKNSLSEFKSFPKALTFPNPDFESRGILKSL
jgi:hypothetical protein